MNSLGAAAIVKVPLADVTLEFRTRDSSVLSRGWQVEGWVIVDNQRMRLDVFPLQNSTARSSVPLIGGAALYIRSVLLCRREPLVRHQEPVRMICTVCGFQFGHFWLHERGRVLTRACLSIGFVRGSSV